MRSLEKPPDRTGSEIFAISRAVRVKQNQLLNSSEISSVIRRMAASEMGHVARVSANLPTFFLS